MGFDTAIFQLDEVVLDTAELEWRAVRDLMTGCGVHESLLPDLETHIREWVGIDSDSCLPDGLEDLRGSFFEFVNAFQAAALPNLGMVPVIESLCLKGYEVLVTGPSLLGPPEEVLRRFRLQDYFNGVVPRIERTESLPSHSFLVSNRVRLIHRARVEGLLPIGFSADFAFMRPILTQAGAEICIDEPAELLALV